MRILFDQATPVPLRAFLKHHTVRTAAQEEWDRLQNGDLLNAAEAAGFDVFLTTDKSIRYQQNLGGRRIAVGLLGKQQWPEVQPYGDLVAAAIGDSTPGCYVEVSFPARSPFLFVCAGTLSFYLRWDALARVSR